MWPFTTTILKQKLEQSNSNQRALENLVIELKVKNESVATCDDQNCGSVFHRRSLQVVKYLTLFKSETLHFCTKHRRPYDRVRHNPVSKEIRYYKEQDPLVEVTAKGKAITKKKKK